MDTKTKEEFFCIECQKWHKPEAFHSSKGNSAKVCSFCVVKQIAKASKKANGKARKYRADKLPPWMFS